MGPLMAKTDAFDPGGPVIAYSSHQPSIRPLASTTSRSTGTRTSRAGRIVTSIEAGADLWSTPRKATRRKVSSATQTACG